MNSSVYKFACPQCGQHLEASDDMAGLDVDCPSCRKRIVVPTPLSTRKYRQAAMGLRTRIILCVIILLGITVCFVGWFRWHMARECHTALEKLYSSSPNERYLGCLMLANVDHTGGIADAVPRLIELLDDSDTAHLTVVGSDSYSWHGGIRTHYISVGQGSYSRDVGDMALDALINSRDPRAVPVLIKRFPGNPEKIAAAFGEFRDPRTIPALINFLKTCPNPYPPSPLGDVAVALGKLGTEETVTALIAELKTRTEGTSESTNRWFAMYIVRGLGYTTDARALCALNDIRAKSKDTELVHEATEGIERIDKMGPMSPLSKVITLVFFGGLVVWLIVGLILERKPRVSKARG